MTTEQRERARFVVRRDPDPEPTGEPDDTGEAWMIFDTAHDSGHEVLESDWSTEEDAKKEAARLNAQAGGLPRHILNTPSARASGDDPRTVARQEAHRDTEQRERAQQIVWRLEQECIRLRKRAERAEAKLRAAQKESR